MPWTESDRQPTEGVAEDADLPDTRSGVDKAFLTFQERVERVPEQVLRFYRLPGVEDPQPLWANNERVTWDQVPPCPLCGAKRQVEFQILSTLLSFLKDEHFSFDSLLVFTCVENCSIPEAGSNKTGWAEEVLISQDFDQQGVRFGRAPE
ncbi:BQ2448_7060 [Microbotryum intermedium]|uniref:BQ2448_7060 protein n=1 Tax=Microbotryum intermedium TaxID=269621 RepID=A0A238FJ09_9BASI|nr:BQ2448_7060 [Microbotryum intermedium]